MLKQAKLGLSSVVGMSNIKLLKNKELLHRAAMETAIGPVAWMKSSRMVIGARLLWN